ncbi:MAG: DUF3842 family protein [Oscillospiraceae bacterium]
MKILIVDGQGGRIGALIVRRLKEDYPELKVVAIGTNSIATSAMIKAGADLGATGENPVVRNAVEADIIVGPIGIITAHAIMGEVTPKMAEAVGGSHAHKVLIPITNCNITVAGTSNMPLSGYINEAVKEVGKLL